MTRHFARNLHTLTLATLFVLAFTMLLTQASPAQSKNAGDAFAVASTPPLEIAQAPTRSNFLLNQPKDYGAGHNIGITEFVAVADVNGDGDPDLIVADQNCAGGCTGNGKVSVLLADRGGRGFKAPVVYDSGGQSATSVAVADLNGDGNPDVVVTNFNNGGSVGVLLGNGNGTFQPVVTYGSGDGPAGSVAIADLNGDGKPDLVVAIAPSHVEVFLGNGDGTFRPGAPYGAIQARSVAVADVNRDGSPDLIVAGATSDGSTGIVSVLLGNGDGTFRSAVNYETGVSTGGWANSVAIADFNGDGKLDLVAANYPDSTVGILIGNGDGTFQPAVLHSAGASLASSVAAADVNGDGKADIVVGDYGNGLAVLLGNGDGYFQPPVMFGATVTSVATADVNRDGRADVVVSNGFSVSVLLNSGLDHAATTTAVSSSLNPSNFGQPVTFSATVTSYGVVPDGELVTFHANGERVGTGATVGGVATFTTSSLKAKTQTIKATYSGDTIFKTSSGEVTQVVNP